MFILELCDDSIAGPSSSQSKEKVVAVSVGHRASCWRKNLEKCFLLKITRRKGIFWPQSSQQWLLQPCHRPEQPACSGCFQLHNHTWENEANFEPGEKVKLTCCKCPASWHLRQAGNQRRQHWHHWISLTKFVQMCRCLPATLAVRIRISVSRDCPQHLVCF